MQSVTIIKYVKVVPWHRSSILTGIKTVTSHILQVDVSSIDAFVWLKSVNTYSTAEVQKRCVFFEPYQVLV